MTRWAPLWTPNTETRPPHVAAILGAWVLLFTLVWTATRPVLFPSPVDVVRALPTLWFEKGLGEAWLSSVKLAGTALVLSTLIGLPIIYLSRVPIVGPIAQGIGLLRFLSPSVFFVLLVFALSTGSQVKVAMLTLGELFFLVANGVTLVSKYTENRDVLDDARTLRMSEWRVTWYVVVRGTLDMMVQIIRDNAAMGFSMVMMVEGIVRQEGGVGLMATVEEKYLNFDAVYAIALTILVVGLLQDGVLTLLRLVICPYVPRPRWVQRLAGAR